MTPDVISLAPAIVDREPSARCLCESADTCSPAGRSEMTPVNGDLDFEMLIDMRHQHQTKQAAMGVHHQQSLIDLHSAT